jgi:hypothetical protein
MKLWKHKELKEKNKRANKIQIACDIEENVPKKFSE